MLRRSAILFISLVPLAALGQVATASGAHAHAAVESTEPRADAVVGDVPPRVFIRVTKKPATRAGDPIQVFGPDGTRVDAGDVVVSEGGSVISVGFRPDTALTGTYHVIYQITSADTHIIEDRYSFAVSPPGGELLSAGDAGPAAVFPVYSTGRGAPLRVIGPPAASVVAVGILTLAVMVLAAMVRRSRRAAGVPQGPAFQVVSTGEHRLGRMPRTAPAARDTRVAGDPRTRSVS